VEGVTDDVRPVTRWADVVSETSNGSRVASHVILLPLAEEPNEEVSLKSAVEYLREEVKVAHEGGLQNDWDVACVEQLDRVGSLVAADTAGSDGKLNAESLKQIMVSGEFSLRAYIYEKEGVWSAI
jgi:hypothetical protein